MARGGIALTEQPTGNFLLDIRRYHELHPSRNRPTTLLVVIVVAGGMAVRERRLRYLRTYSCEMARVVTFQNLYLQSDYTRESGRSPVTNGKTTTRTRTTATRSFVFTVLAPLRYSDAEVLIPALLRSRATEFHRLYAGPAIAERHTIKPRAAITASELSR